MTTLFDDLMGLREEIAKEAQVCLDNWDFETGGACDAIAEVMVGVINDAMEIAILSGGQDGDTHAWLLVFDETTCELCNVNIPAEVYENCHGLYRYSRIDGAKIEARNVEIDWLDDKVLIEDVQWRIAHNYE